MSALIDRLIELAEWADANEWEVPIDLGDMIMEAVEELKGNLDSKKATKEWRDVIKAYADREQLEKALQTELATTAGAKPRPDMLCPANEEHDPVNHPSHYTQGGVECKDAIRAAVTGLEGYEAFITGNAIKYLWRWKRKNGAEDLRKAGFWIRELIDETEGQHEENRG